MAAERSTIHFQFYFYGLLALSLLLLYISDGFSLLAFFFFLTWHCGLPFRYIFTKDKANFSSFLFSFSFSLSMSTSEKEIITVGFGNYSTLVAAQWANSTSQYDVHHHTLYTSRHQSTVYGGNAGEGGRVRVPRLVLLDAPHAVRLEELSKVVEKESKESEIEQGGGMGKTDDHDGTVEPLNIFRSQVQEEQELVPGEHVYAASDQKKIMVARRVAQRAPWEWRESIGFNDEPEEDENHSATENDSEAEDEYDRQRSADRRRRGAHRHHRDQAYQIYTRYIDKVDAEDEEEGEEDEEEEGATHTGQRGEKRKVKSEWTAEQYKRRLFDTRDYTVPWWHYISTGLPRDAVTTLRPPQQADVVNNIAASHSFGYGMSHLTATSPEMEQVLDNLRRQVEDADAMQGLQFFVDADSMFGGAARNALEAFWEDVGAKTPAVVVANYQPLPAFLTNLEEQQHVPFAAQRRQERHLNRLLCTSSLSQSTGAVFIPMEMEHWGEFFTGGMTSSASLPWLEDDRATAQLIAALTDTALYGARDGGGPSHGHEGVSSSRRLPNASERPSTSSPSSTGGAASGESNGSGSAPAFTLQEWGRTVRPTNSLRVQAMMGCLPLRLREAGERKAKDLWNFLEKTPLLGPMSSHRTTQLLAGGGQESRGHATDAGDDEATDSRGPGRLAGDFCPLTHAMPFSPLEERGRVMGHAVSLRGAGVLPSAVYPPQEAMLRYAIPLRTGTYLPLLTSSNYPISNTFPLSLLLDSSSATASSGLSAEEERMMRENLDGVDIGAHVVTTYTSAGMLQQMIQEAKRILAPQFHCAFQHKHQSLYEMSPDDWNEVMEDALQMFDDYHHDVPQDDDSEEEV